MASPRSYAGVIGVRAKLPDQLPQELSESTFTGEFDRLDFTEGGKPSVNIGFKNFDGTGKELVVWNIPRDVGVAFVAYYAGGKTNWQLRVTDIRFDDPYYSANYYEAFFGA